MTKCDKSDKSDNSDKSDSFKSRKFNHGCIFWSITFSNLQKKVYHYVLNKKYDLPPYSISK
jgi:hypothetical protein